MTIIGYIYTSRPLPCDRGGYTVPPPNSRVICRNNGVLYASDPLGFEWVFSEYVPVWLPNGMWSGAKSFESERNFKMRTNGSR